MPNHVHALVMPAGQWDLSKVLHSWKSFMGHEINRLLGRVGPLWQQESFDHIVRGDSQWAKFSRYVKDNAAAVPLGQAQVGCGQLQP